jgi:rare lipoprotein A
MIREGLDGVMLERYRMKVRDGVVVGRDLLARQVLRPAVSAERVVGRAHPAGGAQVGEASWYSFAPGNGLTAAHPWLPFGTVVTVTNLANGKSVQVVINDRGPFGGRIIDLSDEAFARIAPLGQGVCQVRLSW